MQRYPITRTQLEIVCKMALKHYIAAIDSVSIRPVFNGEALGDWRVTCITPPPSRYESQTAQEILNEIHMAFALDTSH